MSDVKIEWSKADDKEAAEFATTDGVASAKAYEDTKSGILLERERAIEIVREVAATRFGTQEAMFDEIIRRLREGRKE